jgi:hypothetical protein
MSGPVVKSDNSGCTIGIGVALLIAFFLAVGKCTGPQGNNTSASALNTATESLTNSISAQDTPPVEPLSRTAVTRGIAHSKLAMNAEGLSGAMIYSQNCYDALSREFTWTKLDVCGAFDMMIVRAIADDVQTGLDKEANWFENETAAGRYISAATGAGEAADETDTRLSQLQARVARAPRAKPTLPPPDLGDDTTENGADSADPSASDD